MDNYKNGSLPRSALNVWARALGPGQRLHELNEERYQAKIGGRAAKVADAEVRARQAKADLTTIENLEREHKALQSAAEKKLSGLQPFYYPRDNVNDSLMRQEIRSCAVSIRSSECGRLSRRLH
jgi:hypothetical protein